MIDPIKSLKEYIRKMKKKSKEGEDLSAKGAAKKLKDRQKQIDAQIKKNTR